MKLFTVLAFTALICMVYADEEYEEYNGKELFENENDEDTRSEMFRRNEENKLNAGSFCTKDRHCKSRHCHRFFCVGKQTGSDVSPNGRCSKHEDCRFEQYCSNSQCTYRQIGGSCRDDAQCMSNHCIYWRCKTKTTV
jgi:hypothetical protein